MSSKHVTKSAAATSTPREGAFRVGLLLASSLAPFLFAAPAQAVCTTSPVSEPLNNLSVGTIVTCTGANNGQTIVGAGQNTVQVDPGATLNNTSITYNGFGTVLQQGSSSDLIVQGAGATLATTAASSINGLSFNITGSGGIFTDGSITSNVGSIFLESGSVSLINNNSSLTGLGGASQYLVRGGGGTNSLSLTRGSLVAGSAGLIFDGGGGNDTVQLNGAFQLGTASGGVALNRRFEGGSGNDFFSLRDVNTAPIEFTVSGFETLNYSNQSGTAGSFTFAGIGDWSTVNVGFGQLVLTQQDGLGQSTSQVNLSSGSNLTLYFARNQIYSLDNVFTTLGSGPTTLNFAGGSGLSSIFLNGNSAGLSGQVLIGANNNVILSQSSSLGNASVAVTGQVTFGDFSVANNFSGTGTLVYSGTGTGSLSGVNTHSGTSGDGVRISSTGTLAVNSVASLGTGSIYIANANGTLQINNAQNQVLTNDIYGDGRLLKTGVGILDMTAFNSHSGGTAINGGAIRVSDLSMLGSGGISTAAGTQLILNYSGASQMLWTAPIMVGAGTFVKEGTGDLVLTDSSVFTGGAIIRAGAVVLNDGEALGSGTVLIESAGTLNIGNVVVDNELTGTGLLLKTASGVGGLTGNNSGFSGQIRIADGTLYVSSASNLGTGAIDILSGAGLTVDNTANETLTNILQGTGEFRKDGAGILSLTGSSSFTGGIFVDEGTLRVASGAVINAASTITLNGASTALELNRDQATTTFGASITGTGQVIKTGAGTYILTGTNTYSGGTAIQQGALRISTLSALGTGPVTVSQGAFLDFNVLGTALWNGAISGAGALRKSGAGDLTLTTNTLTGGLDIIEGRVIVTDPNATGGPVTTQAGTAIVFSLAAGPNVLSTVPISGGGQLIKEGAGALIIGNTNTYTGGTVINQGRVGLNVGDGLGTGTVTVNANGVLNVGNVTFNNAVTGAGSVLKTGSSLAVVTGTSTFTGGTVIQDGGIRITQGNGLGTGQVSLAAGTSLTLDHASAATTANVITGAGVLTKTGGGVTTLTGASTFTGGTTVQGGRLHLATGATTGTGAVSIGNAAQLSFEGGTLTNALSGAGTVAKLGTGTGTLSGTNTHTGGTLVAGGTLNAGVLALGTGAVQIDSGGTLSLTNTGNTTFSNGLSGLGALRLAGTGRMTFGSNFTLGGLQIDAARLRLNAIAQTNVTVGANGALDGTGRVIGNLVNNGLVAPGNSIGTLTVQGNYTHAANSVLEIEFDGSGGIDLLSVTGTAALNGGTLRFVSLGGAEGSGGTFLQAAGGVTGTFGTIETVGAALPLSVIYQPSSGIMAPSILTARPSTFNAQFLAAGDTGLGFIDKAAAAAGDAPAEDQRIWGQAFASSAERDASGASLGYEHQSSGMAGGYTYRASPKVAVGVAGALTASDITLASNGGEGEQDGFMAAIYGGFDSAAVSIVGGVMGGVVDQTATRNVRFNGFEASVTGDTQSSLYGLFAGVTAPVGAFGDWNIEATGRLSLLNQTQDAYTESGTSPLRLRVAEVSTTTLEGQAGVTGQRSFGQDQRSSARFGLGVRYQDATAADVDVTFVGSNAGVRLQTDARETLHGYVAGGLGWAISESTRLEAGYHGQLGETERHEARVTLSVNF